MKKNKSTAKCNNFKPSWQEIAKQIDDSRDQVFEVAIFNLTKIAISCPKYRESILELFQQYLCAKDTNQERKAFLVRKISEIENYQ